MNTTRAEPRSAEFEPGNTRIRKPLGDPDDDNELPKSQENIGAIAFACVLPDASSPSRRLKDKIWTETRIRPGSVPSYSNVECHQVGMCDRAAAMATPILTTAHAAEMRTAPSGMYGTEVIGTFASGRRES